MANVDNFIPFVLKWETGTRRKDGETLPSLFERAAQTGWADDPQDLGGKTMCGVTLSTYQTYCIRKGLPTPTAKELRAISFGRWKDVLKSLYWDKWKADQIRSQSVAAVLVDWVWASGSYGIRIPQSILGTDVDGIVGAKTLTKVNERDGEQLFAQIKAERLAFIDRICKSRPANRKFRQGWINRLDDLKFEG